MSENALQVVFGAGQVGRSLKARLTDLGVPVRIVSRHRPSVPLDGVDWRAADATDPEAATDAAKGASVVYQCLNAPYTEWPKRFPPLQRGVLTAAERSGALLVSLENLYAYGPTGGQPMTEDLPLAATTIKGQTRAAMTGELLAAADAGRIRSRSAGRLTSSARAPPSIAGRARVRNAVSGKRADFIGNPDLPHTYSYIPDIAAGLATLGTDERAVGGAWHLPGPETVTTRALLELVAQDVGHPVGVRSLPKLAVRAFGLFNPMLRELVELSYEFEQPFVLDTAKYRATFSTPGIPLTKIAATVAWYRNRNAAAHDASPSKTRPRLRFSNPATGGRIGSIHRPHTPKSSFASTGGAYRAASITEHLHPHQEERFDPSPPARRTSPSPASIASSARARRSSCRPACVTRSQTPDRSLSRVWSSSVLALHTKEMFEAFGGLGPKAEDDVPRGTEESAAARRDLLVLPAREPSHLAADLDPKPHPSTARSAGEKSLGVRPYNDRWDSRTTTTSEPERLT